MAKCATKLKKIPALCIMGLFDTSANEDLISVHAVGLTAQKVEKLTFLFLFLFCF